VLVSGLAVLAGCGSATSTVRQSPASPPSAASPRGPGDYAAQIVLATNAVRRAQRLPELRISGCARQVALRRASDLTGSTGLTHAPLGGVIARCAPATMAAENLSRAASSPATVVAAWMRSPGHRSNLLDPALTDLGVGCVPDHGKMLCSQVFTGR
jgi:uncharacterized protein YkwD